jgi:hypothetical protein
MHCDIGSEAAHLPLHLMKYHITNYILFNRVSSFYRPVLPFDSSSLFSDVAGIWRQIFHRVIRVSLSVVFIPMQYK